MTIFLSGDLTLNSLRMPRVFSEAGKTPCGLTSIQLTVANQDVSLPSNQMATVLMFLSFSARDSMCQSLMGDTLSTTSNIS